MKLTLYQTLEDRNNADVIELHGPYKCARYKWLGDGYYFWDTHMELAHWWGKTNYGWNSYIICKANAILDDNCWDLHGNGNHRLEFEEICNVIIKAGITTKERLLVAQVIEYFKKKMTFKYDSIRILGMNSIARNNAAFAFRIPFKREDDKRYFDLYPPVQICLLTKKSLSLKNFLVVYPVEYLETYA